MKAQINQPKSNSKATYQFRILLDRDWSFKNHSNSKKNIELFECLPEAKCNLQFNQCLSLILANINSNPLEILSQFNLTSIEKNAQIMSLIVNIVDRGYCINYSIEDFDNVLFDYWLKIGAITSIT